MPAGTIVINDDRVAEFLLQYKQGIEAGTDSRELDRFRAQFQEDMKKQGAKFPPVLNAKLYAMSEAVREATRYAENRKALIEEGNAAAQDIKDVEYTGEDLKDEKQIHSVSCWACSGTMNANNYIARHKDTVDKGFEMTQEHFLNEDNLILNSRAEKKADPEEKKKNPGAEEDELKRAKLDATFEMTSEELLENCVNGSVELFTLVHLDEESIAGIKNEFKIGAEGQEENKERNKEEKKEEGSECRVS